jgi:hypothetical protein
MKSKVVVMIAYNLLSQECFRHDDVPRTKSLSSHCASTSSRSAKGSILTFCTHVCFRRQVIKDALQAEFAPQEFSAIAGSSLEKVTLPRQKC